MFTQAENLDDAFEALKTVADSFAITLGAEGAVIFDGESKIHVEASNVKAVDTNGAGDLFAGAMLFGLTHGFGYQKSAQLASYASGILVTEFGPRLSDDGLLKLKNYLSSIA